MARGKTFGQLVEITRLEAGLDPNPALSLNMVPLIEHAIRREYERLYDDFNWPHLRVRRTITVSAGQRYYDAPNDLNIDRIETVHYEWGERWIELSRGIDPEHYNIHDSDEDERADPAYRWGVLDTGAEPQIEIWPLPATTGGTVRLTGIRNKTELVSSADRCDLDDMMVSLYAAGMLLSRRGAKDAQLKLQEARSRYDMVKARLKQKSGASLNFSSATDDHRVERGTPLVAYVRNP